MDARGAFCAFCRLWARLSAGVELECGEQRTVVRNVRIKSASTDDVAGDGTGEDRRIRIPVNVSMRLDSGEGINGIYVLYILYVLKSSMTGSACRQ